MTLLLVIRREWRRLTSRRLYFGACLVLPLFSLFFMATIFGNGQMENIPIAIVDQENSTASREIVRRMKAVPTFRVTQTFANEALARKAVRQKEVYGYLVIPAGFESQQAPLCYYYHYALMSVGGTLMAAFENSLAAVSLSPIVLQAEALGVAESRMKTFLLPVEADTHPLYNPNMDYSTYLSQPFFFVLFQILILLTTVYSLGSEIKFGTLSQWIDTAKGSLSIAILGKLLPYTAMYGCIGVLANSVFFGLMHIPLSGSLALLNVLTVLFIVATQSLALLVFSLYPRMAYVISGVSMIGSLGATLSGVTFPVVSMYAPVRAASHLFPVRHFMEATQGVVYFGAGYPDVWQSVAFLLLFPLLATAFLPLLRWWSEHNNKIVACETKRDGCVVTREFRRIATSPPILLVLAGGIFLYGLLYNYMYAPNLVRKTPIAVVDLSHSSLSREYIRLLNATPQTNILLQTPDILEARQWMKQGRVEGILYVPSDFEKRVSRGETSYFTLYASTDAFLIFKGLQESASQVMLEVNNRHRADGIVFLPPAGMVAAGYARPIEVVGETIYNPTEGYGSYLIPAVLIVIIFQTLLMLIAMLRGEEAERESAHVGKFLLPHREVWKQVLRLITGRTVAYVMLYSVFSCFLIGFLPHLFGIPHQGTIPEIVGLMVPFLVATSFFGLAISRWFTDSEAPLLMIAFFSVGYIFLSGISYPLELMPWYWKAAHHLFPVAPAALAFVKQSSMDATWSDVAPQILTLWIQVLVYGVWAWCTTRRAVVAGNLRA